MPGLIEAHTHVEDALLVPGEFARVLAPRGTTTCVSNPHEIANVAWVLGLRWMLEAAQGIPLRMMFPLPSCMPASHYKSAGVELKAEDLLPLASDPHIASVGEVMNYPGVLEGDQVLLEMISLSRPGRATPCGLPVDGALTPDPARDLLKVAVVERYGRGRVGVGLLRGRGLRAGAMASSVADDAHNIVVVGANDEDMALRSRD